MPHNFTHVIGKRQIDLERELKRLQEQFFPQREIPPEERPSDFRQSQKFEGLFPEFKQQGLPGRVNPFRRPTLVTAGQAAPLAFSTTAVAAPPPIELFEQPPVRPLFGREPVPGVSASVTAGGFFAPPQPPPPIEPPGDTHYWDPVERAWKLKKQPPEVPLSRMPFSRQLEPLGEISPFKEIGETMTSSEAEEVKSILSFIGLVGYVALTAGQGIGMIRDMTAWRRLPEYKEIVRLAKESGVPRSSKVFKDAEAAFKSAVNLYRGGAKEAAQSIMSDYYRAQARFMAARATTPAAKDAVTRAVALIPRGTQTGAMAFGGLGKPAQVIKVLPSAADTAALKTTQALGKKIGLDVEAVGGIAPGEYWVSISAKTGDKTALKEWLKNLPEVTQKEIGMRIGGIDPATGRVGAKKGMFAPFKNIQDAQKFLETGDTSLIAKTITQRGVPWTPDKLAETREAARQDIVRRTQELEPIQQQINELQEQVDALEPTIKAEQDIDKWKSLRSQRGALEAQIGELKSQYAQATLKAQPSTKTIPPKPEVTPAPEVIDVSGLEEAIKLHQDWVDLPKKEIPGYPLLSREDFVGLIGEKQFILKAIRENQNLDKALNLVNEYLDEAKFLLSRGVLTREGESQEKWVRYYSNLAEQLQKRITPEPAIPKAEAGMPVAPKVTPAPEEVTPAPEVTYYHTTTAETAKQIEQAGFKAVTGERVYQNTVAGTFLYPNDIEAAQIFGKNLKSPSIIETKVTGKVYDANTQSLYGWENDLQITEIARDRNIINQLKKDGYVGITSTELNTPVTFIFEPSAIKLAIPKAEAGMPEARGITPVGAQPPSISGGIGGVSPPSPPVPPTKTQKAKIPEPTAPSGRPRTLADLNREAKGMRALKPDERAAIMDVVRPISEGELLYKVKPFEEHARNLLQPDTPIKQALRSMPGVKQAVRLWTPAQMERDNPVAMIGVRKQIFEEIEIGRARLAILNWWHDADEAFNFKQVKGKWRATSVELTAKAEPSKPYHATIHDLVEHPENYNFTPEQQRVLQMAQDMQRQIMRDAQRAGVDAVELFNDYWRRIVIKAPSTKIDTKTRSRIAQRKGYTRQRVFDFVDEGTEAGYEYETHPLTAFQNRLEAGIRTISDQETRQAIARLPGVEKPLERLESRYPQTVEGARQARQARDAAKTAFLRDKTVENETALRQAEADFITAMREIYTKKLEVGQPNIGELKLPNGRIAPAELVNEVRKWVDLPELQTSVGSFSNNVLEVTRLFRTTLTNVDLAAGFIQGQALFYRNNVAWWRGQANAIVALIDDPTAYVAKNFDLMDEGMRMGAISIPTEFLFARQGLASIPTRVPIVGPPMKAFNRAFEWFILTGQTELYKAAREAAIKRAGGKTEQEVTDALVSLGSAIRKELGTESYAILGVRPNQHTIEQLSLFAARFFRALTGFQAQAFTGGEAGHEARRGMGSLLAGGLALTIAASYASEREMPKLTDPFKPGWMSVKIGKTYFNAFGPFYPYLRTQARVGVYVSQGRFDKAANELNRFMKSKAGLPLRGIDMAAQFGVKGYYTTFEGKTLPKTPLGIGEAVLGEMVVPISIQEALKSLPEGRPESAIGEIVGLVGRENYPYFPEEMLAPYFDIPTSAIELRAGKEDGTIEFSREEYRKEFPAIDAMLFLKGYVTTIKKDEAKQFVLDIVKREGYDPRQIRAVKQWQRDQDKLKEAGLEDENITLTEELIMELLGLEKPEEGLKTTPRETIPAALMPGKEPIRERGRLITVPR